MKAKLLVIVLLVTANCFAQKSVDFKLDEDFSIRIPNQFQDTIINNQHFIFADIDFGRIVLAKVAFPDGASSPVAQEDDLTKIYDDIQRGMLKKIKGKLVAEEYIKVHSLKTKKLAFLFEQAGERFFDETLLIFFSNKVYTIQAIQATSMAKELKSQRDSLFASIQIAKKITPKDQFTTSPPKAPLTTKN